MESIIKWRKDEGLEKQDFNRFMREVAVKAKKLQEEKSAFEPSHAIETDTKSRDSKRPVPRPFNQRPPNVRTSGSTSQYFTQNGNTNGTAGNKTGTKRKRE